MATSTTSGTPASTTPAPSAPAPSSSTPTPAAAKSEDVSQKKGAGVKSFLSGGFGGVCSVLVGQPFDLTKTRLQTAAPGQYTGMVDVVKQTIARDGLKGFYRGMGPPLVGVTPMFAGYAMGKKIVYSFTPERTSPTLSNAELAFAGFFSAVPTTLVATPVERVKVLLQMQGQGGKQMYSGPLDAVTQLYKQGGIKSIYRGTGATLARDGPGSAAYFLAYEAIKKKLTPAGQDPAQLSLSAVVVAGGFAGVTMWTFAIPPDVSELTNHPLNWKRTLLIGGIVNPGGKVIKSRLQGAPEGTYKGFVDCAMKTVKNDGAGALFKGFGPAMLRAFPANAATFLGVELSLQLMNSLW